MESILICNGINKHGLDKSFQDDYFWLLSANLLEEFNKRRNSQIDATYDGREDRNRFASTLFHSKDSITILNIGGGGKRHLEKYLKCNCSVHELDLAGDCDTFLNLDCIEKLPFGDSSFDTCCAFDVLEHLENIHLIIDELYRVSKTDVIISLPNAAAEIINNVLRNRPQKRPDINRGTYSKYYGLPIVKPVDRHRWWIYFFDVVRFFLWFEKNHKCIVEFFVPTQSVMGFLAKTLLGDHIYYTFFCPHIWVKITK